MNVQMRDDLKQRRLNLQRAGNRAAAQEAHLGDELDAMNREQLRQLFDAAFARLAEFEWGLQVRRGKISMPQRAALLEALNKQEAIA
ncbi:hypothetical protein [Lacipirellula limnantheis]|uniref:Uncharacterized protein n=1 Tax=Lacipirellula limnantheis TaxID=2528024 RepID=A0A517U5B1_9BACT|nr:hypothetical protein [Lacipirellula limnantheis]QDT75750.1 hypothetical protein I41_49920 [Lacipirellula limnantheis]